MKPIKATVHNSMRQARDYDPDVYDIVCIGFRPAFLSIAIALDDRHKELKPSDSSAVTPGAVFLEK
jgi:lysine/ornithine N-monooxygenase